MSVPNDFGVGPALKPATQLLRAAFHEAGHAVIAVREGRFVRERGIVIDKNRPGHGNCHTRAVFLAGELTLIKPHLNHDTWQRTRRTALGEVREILAGGIAEQIAFGWDEHSDEWSLADQADAQEKLKEVLHLDGLDETDLSDMLWTQTAETERVLRLTTSWRAVTQLANVLAESGAVSMDQAAQLTRGVRRFRAFR